MKKYKLYFMFFPMGCKSFLPKKKKKKKSTKLFPQFSFNVWANRKKILLLEKKIHTQYNNYELKKTVNIY